MINIHADNEYHNKSMIKSNEKWIGIEIERHKIDYIKSFYVKMYDLQMRDKTKDYPYLLELNVTVDTAKAMVHKLRGTLIDEQFLIEIGYQSIDLKVNVEWK